MQQLKIGMVGLDTSHAVLFAGMLNEKDSEYNRLGKIVKAFPGGSSHLPISRSRIEGITEEVRKAGVNIVGSIEEAVVDCDAVLLESVDGGIHLEQLKRILPYKVPVFVDKPFALSVEDAVEMERLAGLYQVPLMSSSALRYADEWKLALSEGDKVTGADCYGPLDFLEGQPGYFWYGIHTIETLYTFMGAGVEWVQAETGTDHDMITARWKDGRIGTFRGNRGNQQFGAVAHFGGESKHMVIRTGDTKYYARLMEHILRFFKGEAMGPPLQETIEVIRFIEAANRSRQLNGERIWLQTL